MDHSCHAIDYGGRLPAPTTGRMDGKASPGLKMVLLPVLMGGVMSRR